MDWKNRIQKPRFRSILCAVLAALTVVSLVVPGVPLQPMEQADPLAQQEIRDIEPVRLGDEADGSNAIIIPIEGGEDAQQTLEVSEGDGIAGEGEAQTGETRPEEILPVEVEGEKIDQEKNSTGSGDQGQEDGNAGEEGGEQIQPDLAAVMLWERQDGDTTVVCTPYQTVAATVNLAQLKDGFLHYEFYLTGSDVGQMEITGVRVSVGNDVPRDAELRGQLEIVIPEGEDSRTWFFWVEAEGKNADGEKMTVTFTYVLKCENRLDLNLVLEWEKQDGKTSAVTCRADETASRTVDSGDLESGAFHYTPKLTGSRADGAKLVRGKYTTLSGDTGELDVKGGTLQLKTPENVEAQIYDLYFEAEVGGRTVSYKISLHYRDVLSVGLNVTWFAGDTVPVSKTCQSGGSVDYTIRTSQIRNGSARFALNPEGEDAGEAAFLSVSYQGSDGTGGTLTSSQGPAEPFTFQLPVSLGDTGASSYTITAIMMAGGKNLVYTIQAKYASDMTLQMTYALADGTQQQIVCEYGENKEAQAISTDQLKDGMLSYTMTARNVDGNTVPIEKVTCYQSGDLKEKWLEPEDTVQLLLNDRKTGENTFTVTVTDQEKTYTFRINIPYEPQGQEIVQFWTSLTDGDDVINENVNNFSVRAWVETENGETTEIRNGNGQFLKVMMDGEIIPAKTHSGSAMEYDLIPANPEVGDTNQHTIHIEAKDEYGNWGELEFTLRGNRRMPGQVRGSATIRLDMTVLGKGIQSVDYTVLTSEPVSVSVAKAVWGHDYGDPFGAAEETLGWADGSYDGTLEDGFYLSRLYNGGPLETVALPGESWSDYGSSQDEILSAIDAYFGDRTDMAALWRCLYRNEVGKAVGEEDSVGELDYTAGSGWVYSLNDGYFPGESMCEYFLQDGDVLTLSYTLAWGWDLGSGTPGYGGEKGYCVQAQGERLVVTHNWEDHTSYSECSHCGLKTYCTHPNTDFRKTDAFCHERYCTKCDLTVENNFRHEWSEQSASDAGGHTCRDCGYSEAHSPYYEYGEQVCGEPYTITESCRDCAYTKVTEETKKHNFVGQYNIYPAGHSRLCDQCGAEEEVMAHDYQYTGDGYWICSVCNADHSWGGCDVEFEELEWKESNAEQSRFSCHVCGREDFWANHQMQTAEEATCSADGVQVCELCGYEVPIPKTEEHIFADGVCTVCSAADPDYHQHIYENGVCIDCQEADPNYVQGTGEAESGAEEVSLFARLRRYLPGRTIWEERI